MFMVKYFDRRVSVAMAASLSGTVGRYSAARNQHTAPSDGFRGVDLEMNIDSFERPDARLSPSSCERVSGQTQSVLESGCRNRADPQIRLPMPNALHAKPTADTPIRAPEKKMAGLFATCTKPVFVTLSVGQTVPQW